MHTHIYTYVHAYIDMHTYTYICTHMSVSVFVFMNVCIYVHNNLKKETTNLKKVKRRYIGGFREKKGKRKMM